MSSNSQQHQNDLHRKLWDMANSLRGQMESSEFKNYILGVIFYRFLSEKSEETAEILLKDDPELTYAGVWSEEESRDNMEFQLVDTIGYAMDPAHLFSSLLADIQEGTFSIETLQEGVNALNSSTIGTETQESFDNLFDDLDLNSSKLGRTNEQRTTLIAKIIQHIADIPFSHKDVEIDVLGDAYEYMISKFAATAGKSAGEFYTPQQVSRILAKIVSQDKEQLKSVYDPTCGSGSLLLRIAKETKVMSYYGQELTSSTYNLSRMNMMLHGVNPQNFDIKNENTLTAPQHLGKKFEAIVANPPYSAHWDSSSIISGKERFSDYEKMAPKTKADFAFVQHMIYHLDDNGTMAVVLPHGVLFRGAAEGSIRKHLIEKNYLDAVIGLPANIFYGTSIPTCILVFKKCREEDDKVLFIDASKEFEKGKNSNTLRDSDVDKIVNGYVSRNDVERFSRSVSIEEIEKNGYNLNIPRYVDSSELEEIVDLNLVSESLEKLDLLLSKTNENLKISFEQLDEVPVYELIAKELFENILQGSHTLIEVALIRNSALASGIFTYDGDSIESHAYDDYTTQLNGVSRLSSKIEKSLGTGGSNLLILVNNEREYSIFVDERVGEVATNKWGLTSEGKLKIVEKEDSERWSILRDVQKNHSAYLKGTIL